MKSSSKKIQVICSIISGVGLFLPLLKLSASDASAKITFMELFDSSKDISSVINSKIVLGVLIAAFIVQLITLVKKGFAYKLVSLLFILAFGVLFYIDVNKLSALKSLLSSMMKYDIGYYITLGAVILAFIIGLVELFNSSNNYEELERIIDNYQQTNNEPVNNCVNQVSSVKEIELEENNTPSVQDFEPVNNDIVKLSDIVKHQE